LGFDRYAGRLGRFLLALPTRFALAVFVVEYGLGFPRGRSIGRPDTDRSVVTGGGKMLAIGSGQQTADLIGVAVKPAHGPDVGRLAIPFGYGFELGWLLRQVPNVDVPKLIARSELAARPKKRDRCRPRA